jgi:hypothetical protein
MPVLHGWFNRLATSIGDASRVIFLLWLVSGIGLVSLLLPAGARVSQDDWAGALIVIGSGLFLAGASVLAGALVGFLFGVPRRQEAEAPLPQESKSSLESAPYRPNTNLEQISDWLTKIMVGIGLTQIPTIVGFFQELGKNAGPAFGQTPSGEIIAISIVIHYLLVGFFQGFLLAYLWLPGAFFRAIQGFGRQNANTVVTTEPTLEDP